MAALLWGQAASAQDFYVVVSGGGVGVKITTVPYTISGPGFYYLGKNLTHIGTTHAITVAADNVTLDLMGFSLTHTGAVGTERGIYMNNRANVEIRNGTVSGFYEGIRENNGAGSKHRVINVRAINNTTSGIFLYGTNHLVKGCDGCNNGTNGIFVEQGVIADCVAGNNSTYNIRIHAGSVLGNHAFGNALYNFWVGSGFASPTSILVDRNSAFGAVFSNYIIDGSPTGVVMGTNSP